MRRCDGPDEFRKAIREEIKRGAEIIKLFVTGGHGVFAPKELMEMTELELRAAADTAHERGKLIRGHIVSKRAILMAVDAGIDVIDHGDEMDAECIERIVEAGTFVAPSVFFPTAFLQQVGTGLGFTASMQAELEQSLAVLPEANAAGVKLVVGDDYGAMGFDHGRYAEEARGLRPRRRHPAARRDPLGDHERRRADGARTRIGNDRGRQARRPAGRRWRSAQGRHRPPGPPATCSRSSRTASSSRTPLPS